MKRHTKFIAMLVTCITMAANLMRASEEFVSSLNHLVKAIFYQN